MAPHNLNDVKNGGKGEREKMGIKRANGRPYPFGKDPIQIEKGKKGRGRRRGGGQWPLVAHCPSAPNCPPSMINGDLITCTTIRT
jgi:hypothetical protein